jgi:hypothetical protein
MKNEKTFTLLLLNDQTGEYETEGYFTTLREIALYLDIPKGEITKIANCDYHLTSAEYHSIAIQEGNYQFNDNEDDETLDGKKCSIEEALFSIDGRGYTDTELVTYMSQLLNPEEAI